MSLNLDQIDVLVTDWDETVTTEDTMATFSEAAYLHKPEFQPPWSYFGEMYYKDYEAYTSEFEKTERRSSVEEEAKFLDGLRKVELESVNRVQQCKLFKNVPQSIIQAQAEKVPIRQGWWDVLALTIRKKIPVVILSVNWGSTLIEEVLKRQGYSVERGGGRGESNLNTITVYANDIVYDNCTGLATGEFIGHPIIESGAGIRTAQDKREVIKKIRNYYKTNNNGKEKESCLTYFGDSSTDILALLEADIGVIVHKETLMKRLKGLGVSVIPISELDEKEEVVSDNGSSDDNNCNGNIVTKNDITIDSKVYYLAEWTDLLS